MKKTFLFIAVVLLIFAGYFFYQNKISTAKKNITQQQTVLAYLKINGQNDFVKDDILLGKTALDLTKEKATVKTKGEGINAYITEINGQTALDSKKEYWALYINGTLAKVGAGSYILKSGDKIEWKIEKY